jgi:asparagine synthase (glutamine-hydrolysing)
MSGIAGVFLVDGRPLDLEDVRRSLKALAHRGPDGSAVWCGDSVGLGHATFWTTPESIGERMPLAQGPLVITADARLDNRDELSSLMAIDAPRRREMGDAELILRAYRKWDESCVDRLLGDFAFAIWNANTRALFCARDHFGVKPFFYYRSEQIFVFASEIKGLLAAADIPRRLNEAKVADYLLSILDDTEGTFYRDVFRLPAAHCMTITRDAVRRRRYWALDPHAEIHLRSDEEYAGAFREKFAEAVRCRLRSAFPVGAMLSGGLDSSAVVCMAREAHSGDARSPLHTFSAIFPAVPECDERRFSDSVVAGNGVRPHQIPCDSISPLADYEETLRQQDEPFVGPNLFMYQALYAEAQRHGVRIMLDGIDGDTTVSHGLARLTELAAAGKLLSVFREAGHLSRHFGRRRRDWLWSYALRPFIPATARTTWRRARLGKDHGLWTGSPLIRKDFVRSADVAERVRRVRAESASPPKTARDDHWRRATSAGFQSMFELVDKVASPRQLESRHPFFDRRLVQFCVALPPDQKLRNGWTRGIMRRALAGILPDTIRFRPGKTRFDGNFTRALLGFERSSLESFVKAPPAAICKYIDTVGLRHVYEQLAVGNDSWDAFTIWKTVVLAKWLQSSL